MQHGLRVFNGAVVALAQSNWLLELEPSAGLHVGIALLDEAVPVTNGTAQSADVNEVEVLVRAVDPLTFSVVDVELGIGWDPAGLNGTQICAQDIAARVLVSEIDGPDASAGADVEDAVWRWRNGSVIQLAAENQGEDVVQQVEAVLFLLVVGQWVGARAVAMITATIGVLVVEDGGGERGRGRAVGVEGTVCIAAAIRLQVGDGLESARVLRRWVCGRCGRRMLLLLLLLPLLLLL